MSLLQEAYSQGFEKVARNWIFRHDEAASDESHPDYVPFGKRLVHALPLGIGAGMSAHYNRPGPVLLGGLGTMAMQMANIPEYNRQAALDHARLHSTDELKSMLKEDPKWYQAQREFRDPVIKRELKARRG